MSGASLLIRSWSYVWLCDANLPFRWTTASKCRLAITHTVWLAVHYVQGRKYVLLSEIHAWINYVDAR